jgi:putative ABC transport system permease protein
MTGREPEPGASWPGLRRVFRLPATRHRVRAEVSDELWFHIEERIEELMTSGLSREQAEAEVRRRFGDVGRVGDELEQIDAVTRRQRRRGELLHVLWRDMRYALRGMARRPGYTAIVVATLALGIGANTAIFSAVNAVLLRPVPTPQLDRVVAVRGNVFALNLLNGAISPGAAVDLALRRDLFQTSTAFRLTSQNLTGLGEPRRVLLAQTMGEFFTTFGVQPAVGMFYRPEDSQEGARRVVVLSGALWHELSGGDAGFVGRSIELNGRPHEVIGVMPPSFRYPYDVQIYMPFELDRRVLSPEQRWSLYMTFVGRLAPGVTSDRLPTEFRAEVTRWGERLGAPEQHAPTNYALTAVPFVEHVSGDLRQILLVLSGAVLVVLLIACANVGSLQLVRAMGRAKELAVRAALGAGRGAIARQLLVENVVIALAGGMAGVVLGRLLLGLIARYGAAEYRALDGVALDGSALGFTALVAILAGLAFGTAPALRAARVDVQDTLKGAGRGASLGFERHRFLRGSVVLQLALTLVLLAASALTVRSLGRLLAVDPGFRPENVMSMRLSLPGGRYSSGPLRVTFYESILERVRGIPGIVSVGLVAYPPFTGGSDSSPFEVEGMPSRPGEPARHANTQIIAGDYLRTMGIPVLRGRAFEPGDNNPNRSVALIDAELARHYFGGIDPIGKSIAHGAGPATIIGVVGSVNQSKLDAPLKATVYHYYPQYSWLSFTTVVVRSALPPPEVSSIVRAAVAQLDPSLPVYDAKPMTERVASSLAARRLAVTILAGFAALSLLLAVLGIYGVMSYTTGQRTRELGIRVALGAEPGAVVRMVLRGGLVLAGVGLVAGAIVFLGLRRALRALLYGIGPNEPVTLALSVAALIAATLVACYVPARRAARVDPVSALREE